MGTDTYILVSSLDLCAYDSMYAKHGAALNRDPIVFIDLIQLYFLHHFNNICVCVCLRTPEYHSILANSCKNLDNRDQIFSRQAKNCLSTCKIVARARLNIFFCSKSFFLAICPFLLPFFALYLYIASGNRIVFCKK